MNVSLDRRQKLAIEKLRTKLKSCRLDEWINWETEAQEPPYVSNLIEVEPTLGGLTYHLRFPERKVTIRHDGGNMFSIFVCVNGPTRMAFSAPFNRLQIELPRALKIIEWEWEQYG